jgi:hypothetical protein
MLYSMVKYWGTKKAIRELVFLQVPATLATHARTISLISARSKEAALAASETRCFARKNACFSIIHRKISMHNFVGQLIALHDVLGGVFVLAVPVKWTFIF